ncbi:hypothetical protein OHB26_24050 [Nocardia sp. NBC_01503]|uniref:hypothetical protein n=1 Tax=Nocardia sp. NBC_01503 TaxID=2975997 RepID=UPI002E7AEA9A|nr:hypothetical protein [Nocardia sp. NBC_01503]WTL30023.1 hypothetical protein OHB26_24050 [Nocardia sp. NBC_01503]
MAIHVFTIPGGEDSAAGVSVAIDDQTAATIVRGTLYDVGFGPIQGDIRRGVWVTTPVGGEGNLGVRIDRDPDPDGKYHVSYQYSFISTSGLRADVLSPRVLGTLDEGPWRTA